MDTQAAQTILIAASWADVHPGRRERNAHDQRRSVRLNWRSRSMQDPHL